MKQIITPAKTITGSIELQGDKSISHRALMLSAIAEGTSKIENLSSGKDVACTMTCLERMGIRFDNEDGNVLVHGMGLMGLKAPQRPLDVGNSGTTIRLLTGILCGQNFSTTIDGDDSIRSRPMLRIMRPLQQMGAKITGREGGFAPLEISPSELRGINYRLPIASAQVKSCLLLAALYAEGTTIVDEPRVSRDHTERMLGYYGAQTERAGTEITLKDSRVLQARDLVIPGDFSSAAFFIAMALLGEQAELRIRRVGFNPTRRAFLSVLSDMGAELTVTNVTHINNEIVADILVRASKLRGLRVNGNIVPQIIDEIPVLAVLATQAEGETVISGASELRYKESDRLRAITTNLKKMGAQVAEKEDGLVISGPVSLRAAELDSFNDHRIAMSFATAGLVADGETAILNAECADISFPGFYETLRQVAGG